MEVWRRRRVIGVTEMTILYGLQEIECEEAVGEKNRRKEKEKRWRRLDNINR